MCTIPSESVATYAGPCGTPAAMTASGVRLSTGFVGEAVGVAVAAATGVVAMAVGVDAGRVAVGSTRGWSSSSEHPACTSMSAVQTITHQYRKRSMTPSLDAERPPRLSHLDG